jgi:hypothetical protein
MKNIIHTMWNVLLNKLLYNVLLSRDSQTWFNRLRLWLVVIQPL